MTRDGGSRYPPKNDDIIYERPHIPTRTFMDVSKLRKHVQIHSRSHSWDEMPDALRRQESQQSRKTLGPPTSLFSQKKKRAPGNKKQQITVSLCQPQLGVPPRLATFSHFYLPLVASIKPERSRFQLETLVHAKWLELGFKSMAISGNLEQSSSCSSSSPCILYKTKKKQNQTEHLQMILLPSTNV